MIELTSLFHKTRAQILRLLFENAEREAHLRDLARMAGLSPGIPPEYDAVGTVSQSEADELRDFTRELQTAVLAWLRKNHPSLIISP